MTMHDRQDELGAILAQIAMIAEDVNVIALAGSGVGRAYAEQMAIIAEVQLRLREMLALGDERKISTSPFQGEFVRGPAHNGPF
jgi:hypothetical protein